MRRVLLSAVALCALAVVSAERRIPAPTPGPFGGLEEFIASKGDQKARRKAWFAEMRRAPPGVDVDAVEEHNGLDQIARRNGLAEAPPSTEGSWVERGSDNQAGRMHVARVTADGTKLYAGSSRGGVWKSDPDGTSWEPIGDNLYGGAHWLEVLETDSGRRVVAATDGGLIHHSDDEGVTWVAPSGQPEAMSWIHRLLMTSDGSQTLYVVLDASRMYRSADAGSTFVQRKLVDHDYWGSLNAGVVDAELVAYGGIELHVSRDGGQSASKKNNWWAYYTAYGGDEDIYLHADIMGIDVRPEGDGEVWYVDTDGGLYTSTDSLATVHNLSLDGLRASQYYDVHTSWNNPDRVLAGAQDQGWQVTAYATQDADEPLEFYQLVSGDYGHITSGDNIHDLVYTTYPGFVLIQHDEDNPWTEGVSFPADESYVPWIPPVLADPLEPTAFFFPATRLYRATEDSGWTYEAYSPDFQLADGEMVRSARVTS